MSLIRAFFCNTGAILLTAASGEEGWLQFIENKVDLVVTDIKLPDTNGITLIGKMKRARPEIPVMVQTGSTVDFTIQDCLEAGCNGYLSKPYSQKQFLGMVGETLRKKSRFLNDLSVNQA